MSIFATNCYQVMFGLTPVCFKEGVNGITPIPYDENLPPNPNWSSDLTHLVKGYMVDAQKIRQRYPQGLSEVVHLNFSALKLTHLPPHILLECKSAITLDISGNDIFFLPVQLKSLRLSSLDISRNLRLQPNLSHFDWLLEMPGLEVTANDMGFNFIPRGWNGRFHSNQIQPGTIDCETQLTE